MAQHRRASSTGQDTTVYLDVKDKGISFKDTNVHNLDRENGWFERGLKEVIYVKIQKRSPSLNRGGRL